MLHVGGGLWADESAFLTFESKGSTRLGLWLACIVSIARKSLRAEQSATTSVASASDSKREAA